MRAVALCSLETKIAAFIPSPVHTSRVLVHGFDSKSNAAGFKSSAVCFARFHAGRRVAVEPLGGAQP
jgi:hypothetical protein